MQTYIKLVIGTFCLVFLFSGTSYIQAATKDKNFNNDVYRLQKILASDSDIYPEGKLTGILDTATTDAIKRFSELYYKASNFGELARQAGSEAKIKSDVSSLRASAEIHYDGNGNSYKGFCKSTNFNNVKKDLKKYKSTVTCSDEQDSYQVNANLPGTKNYYCADSTGQAKTISLRLKKGIQVCP